MSPAVDGLVSLSGEGELRGRAVHPELGRYAGPVLVISAPGDDYAADTLTTFPTAHTRGPTSVLRLSGADHGWELLRDQHAAQVEQAIDSFLRRSAADLSVPTAVPVGVVASDPVRWPEIRLPATPAMRPRQ